MIILTANFNGTLADAPNTYSAFKATVAGVMKNPLVYWADPTSGGLNYFSMIALDFESDVIVYIPPMGISGHDLTPATLGTDFPSAVQLDQALIPTV